MSHILNEQSPLISQCSHPVQPYLSAITCSSISLRFVLTTNTTMHGTQTLSLFLGLVVVGTAFSLPGPLSLATTFSQIANDLDDISLGSCSLKGIELPLNNTKVKLPNPSPKLNLKYVAIGRGTQNYSCPSSGSSSKSRRDTTPEATGAVATLFDASCLASTSTNLLHELPAVVGKAPLGPLAFLAEILSSSTNTTDLIIGEHYFNSDGEPVFDLGLADGNAWMVAKKNASVDAPKRESNTSKSDAIKDVPWLKLDYKKGKGLKVRTSWLYHQPLFSNAICRRSTESLLSKDPHHPHVPDKMVPLSSNMRQNIGFTVDVGTVGAQDDHCMGIAD